MHGIVSENVDILKFFVPTFEDYGWKESGVRFLYFEKIGKESNLYFIMNSGRPEAISISTNIDCTAEEILQDLVDEEYLEEVDEDECLNEIAKMKQVYKEHIRNDFKYNIIANPTLLMRY